MKVFAAGATGAMGRRLVPQLVTMGYEVVAMTRSEQKAGPLRAMGAEPVVADALDRDAVVEAVRRAAPLAPSRARPSRPLMTVSSASLPYTSPPYTRPR